MPGDNLQNTQTSDDYELDLSELFARLLASWKLIVLLSLIGMIAAFTVTQFLITPKYQASSTIYVLSRKDSAVNISDLQIGASLTQDYAEVFNMWEVHEEVISNLDLPYTYEQIKSMLNVTNVTNTRMLKITVTSPDPEEAAKIANEYASVSSSFIAETLSTDKPNVVSAALVPSHPVSPNKTRNTAIGGIAGFVLAAAIVFIGMLRDDKIKTADDVNRYTGMTTLAIVPIEDADSSNKQTKKR